MAVNLANVFTFFTNRDQHAAFRERVAAAIQEWAIDARAEAAPSPVTGEWAARQRWADWALKNPMQATDQMLPGLVVVANNAGLISADGILTATDQQIRATVGDSFVDRYAGYVPEVG